ncbi:hypothetical protein [Nitrospira sp. Kam-Ns4a]
MLQGAQYRVLYFFHGTTAVVLSRWPVKERVVPVAEIELAIKRKRRFAMDPQGHTHREG